MKPEIKVLVNGTEIAISDELIEMINEQHRQRNPFARVKYSEKYFYIDNQDNITEWSDANTCLDRSRENHANYFNNYMCARQTMLHQLLYRKLLKFGYDNECEDIAEWEDCNNSHYKIFYRFDNKAFCVDSNDIFKQQGVVYFSSGEAAKRAINEVVKPFMEEYPEFTW